MNSRTNVFRGHYKVLRVDPKNSVVPLIPEVTTGGNVQVPRAHISSRQREASSLFALHQLNSRGFQRRGPFRDARLQFLIQLLELPRLAIQLGEYLDLRPQHFGDDGNWNIVDRAHFVATQTVHFTEQNGRYENDRCFLKSRVIADHGGKLEAVQVGHADVDQDNGDVRFKQMLKRFPPRACLEQVFVQAMQDGFIAQQF